MFVLMEVGFRWAGCFGIDADFITTENCRITYLLTKDIQDCAYCAVCSFSYATICSSHQSSAHEMA